VRVASGPSEEEVQLAFAEGQRAWPGIALGLAAFGARVAEVGVAPASLMARAADLFIATACTLRDDQALVRFDAQYLAGIAAYLGRLRVGPELIGELRQQARLAILLGANPLIGQYRGSGPLLAWVRVIVVRTALAMTRVVRAHHQTDVEALDRLISPDLGPEASAIKARYRTQLQTALTEALAALSDHEKALLRLHFVDGLGVEGIGRIYQVHRATAARWLVTLRRQVLQRVRQALALPGTASSSELRSLVTLLRNELELSLHDVLR
jgi:RNA polymerase sigma-70 factor (ECF subfamily)